MKLKESNMFSNSSTSLSGNLITACTELSVTNGNHVHRNVSFPLVSGRPMSAVRREYGTGLCEMLDLTDTYVRRLNIILHFMVTPCIKQC